MASSGFCSSGCFQFRELSKTRSICSIQTHTSDFILNTFSNEKPVQFFPGEVLSGDGGMPRERVLQQSLKFSGGVGWQN